MQPRFHDCSQLLLVFYELFSSKVFVLYTNFLSCILTILTPWLFEKSYEMKQMDTVTTSHVDFLKKFIQWDCSFRARQHFTLPWKQNTFVVHDNHCCRCPHFTAPCRTWTAFFTTVGPGLATWFVHISNTIYIFRNGFIL